VRFDGKEMLLLVAMVGLAASVMVARRGEQVPDWTRNPTRDFPLVGGDYYHQRYSALDQIKTSNVKNLGGVTGPWFPAVCLAYCARADGSGAS